MRIPRLVLALAALSVACMAAISTGSSQEQPPPEKPKIRTITAFITLDVARYADQIQDALAFLRSAKTTYEKAGYEVQTIRITTQPFPAYTKGMSTNDVLHFFHQYDELAKQEDFLASIGPAMMKPGDPPELAALLARILAPADQLNGSVVIAGDDGIHWDGITMAANVMKFLGEHSPNSLGNFRFAAVALVPAGTPFFPASFHISSDHQFSLGLQSANVVMDAMSTTHNPAEAQQRIEKMLGDYAQQLETISQSVAQQTRWNYAGIDLSPAPLKRISVASAIESFTGSWIGSSGTLTSAAIITRALQDIPVKHAGYSGLMLPILEDATLARRWSEGALSVDGLLAYSSVCGTGLDVIPLPGKVAVGQLERMLADVASLSVKWHKPLSARLLPIAGKDAGDRTQFDDPHLVNAMIRPLP